jgi:hypothetical protein
MIVDASPRRGIKEDGNQVRSRKRHHKTLSSVVLPPTNHRRWLELVTEDYGLKASITKTMAEPEMALPLQDKQSWICVQRQ